MENSLFRFALSAYDKPMAMNVIPESSSPFGERVRGRLTEDPVIWLTTVGHDLTPQPNPVWFLWDGADSILVYNRANAKRLANLQRRPRVSLNFDSDGDGGDIVILTGDAEMVEGQPPVTEYPEYLEKYRERIVQISGSPEAFAKNYSVSVRIRLSRVRGF